LNPKSKKPIKRNKKSIGIVSGRFGRCFFIKFSGSIKYQKLEKRKKILTKKLVTLNTKNILVFFT
jgi:hypothetical protein